MVPIGGASGSVSASRVQSPTVAERDSGIGQWIAPPSVRAFGYFDPDRVHRLVNKVRSAAASGQPVSHRDSLACLTVLSTQMWHALFQTTWGSL